LYIPLWELVLLFVIVAFVSYKAGAEKVRTAWRKSDKARRERRRQKREEAARQRIRETYGEELDDEAVTMIHDIESDQFFPEDSKRLAIGLEIVENHRRQKAGQEGEK
jgi:hypothetical protein